MERQQQRRLRAKQGDVLVAVLDLDRVSGTAPDGRRYSADIDPTTGLAMPDGIHPPHGVVIAIGDEAARCSDLKMGDRVVVQRDLGRCFKWPVASADGTEREMTLQRLTAAGRCKCDALNPTGLPVAKVGPCGGYFDVPGRLVGQVLAPESASSVLDVPGGAGGLQWTEGGYGFLPASGVRWRDQGVQWVSLQQQRHCHRCNRLLVRSEALVRR